MDNNLIGTAFPATQLASSHILSLQEWISHWNIHFSPRRNIAAILFVLHVVEVIIAWRRATTPIPTAISNKVVSSQAVTFPSILVRALILQSALSARNPPLVTTEPWVATDAKSGAILNAATSSQVTIKTYNVWRPSIGLFLTASRPRRLVSSETSRRQQTLLLTTPIQT